MGWRNVFLRNIGPGLLSGIKAGDWFRLLADNGFAISPGRLPKAMMITSQSLQNSLFALLERVRFGSRVKDVKIPPPIFLLGHWRNGTTHLHNLMTVDNRFAFANNYEALFPHTFLATEATASRMVALFMPKRRPMDNIEWTMKSPQEDEFALNIATLESPCMGWIFPQNLERYNKFLTFQSASASEVARWQAAFLHFARKLTWKYGRPLVLKSPPHTCRIRLLLEMFPDARFVHIHRDPYAVFASTKHTLEVNGELNRLQRARPEGLDERILQQYRTMYNAYFEERKLIPAGKFVEIAFNELEKDPIGQVQRIYESLNLPSFDVVEPSLRQYVDSIAGYQKNAFPELPDAIRVRIAEAWHTCFEEWGYQK